jgi:pyruvate/2-oxoglutarate/acetoin dehydrogenase E1 component
LNPWPLIESLETTHKLLIAEEGHSFAALGAELIAQIQELRPGLLTRCKRIAAAPHPIPSSGPLELSVLPNAQSISNSIRELASNV